MTIEAIEANTAANSETEVSHWMSQDGQREIDVEGMNASEALDWLLNVGNDDDRAPILAGSFQVAQ